jgi:hypothetical protein
MVIDFSPLISRRFTEESVTVALVSEAKTEPLTMLPRRTLLTTAPRRSNFSMNETTPARLQNDHASAIRFGERAHRSR